AGTLDCALGAVWGRAGTGRRSPLAAGRRGWGIRLWPLAARGLPGSGVRGTASQGVSTWPARVARPAPAPSRTTAATMPLVADGVRPGAPAGLRRLRCPVLPLRGAPARPCAVPGGLTARGGRLLYSPAAYVRQGETE